MVRDMRNGEDRLALRLLERMAKDEEIDMLLREYADGLSGVGYAHNLEAVAAANQSTRAEESPVLAKVQDSGNHL
jgi:hypothetical protein